MDSVRSGVVGIEAAPLSLVVARWPGGYEGIWANEEAGVAAVVAKITALAPTLVVLDATGGAATEVIARLALAEVPLVLANARQLRAFALADGKRSRAPPHGRGYRRRCWWPSGSRRTSSGWPGSSRRSIGGYVSGWRRVRCGMPRTGSLILPPSWSPLPRPIPQLVRSTSRLNWPLDRFNRSMSKLNPEVSDRAAAR